MALHLVIFGRQGAGKGTQSQRIVDAYGVVHVSTGDMLRAAIAAETEMGLAVKQILDSGALVDDVTMEGLVRERLSQPDILAGMDHRHVTALRAGAAGVWGVAVLSAGFLAEAISH